MCHVVHAKQAHPHSGLGSCFCVFALDIFRLKNGMEWPCPMNSEVLRCCVQARLLSKNRIEQHFVCFYGTGDRVWCAWFDGKMLDKSSTMNCVFFLGRVYNMCQTLSPMRETERARVREHSISVLSVEKSVLQSHWKWNVNFHKMHPTREHVIYFTTNYWYKAPISVDYKGLSITFFFTLHLSSHSIPPTHPHSTFTAHCIFQDSMGKTREQSIKNECVHFSWHSWCRKIIWKMNSTVGGVMEVAYFWSRT